MRVWTRLENYSKDSRPPLILALGNFDGVHTGHQRILRKAVERAGQLGGVAAALTFAEHPQRVLHPTKEPTLLTSPEHRLLLLQGFGIETCFLLSFTISFARIDAETFVKEWLVDRLGVREIHLGYNAHFGFDRKGDSNLMRNLSKQLHFEFYEADPVEVDGDFVSSTLIRWLIREGKFVKARDFLGRPFSILASVIRGSGRGKALGCPTANLQPHSEILPPRGVYPAEVRERSFHLRPAENGGEFELVDEKPGPWLHGILNYGVRPTFGAEGPEVPEVFLLDYSGNLYGKTVEVVFHQKLRDERTFETPEKLTQAIEGDIAGVKEYFRALQLE